MEALGSAVIKSLEGHPWAIVSVLLIFGLVFVTRLVVQNPKFWDTLIGHMTVNTALTRETNEAVQLMMQRQAEIQKLVNGQEVREKEMLEDLKYLLSHYEPLITRMEVLETHVSQLRTRACLRSPECQNRIGPESIV
jgi:hypothetical protein